ncbi:putative ubiquitin-conjugating enzyme E2 [Trypanosoma cruzi]|uniref:Ubiquitin-conjugating enzyme E2, putative n=2 Tax=Trypanosoma cruzi TaxID=5693 RepID=Q4DIQ3_TRYCC|nr:ubiquitin-conjugating enzyme E2, putative [Trypanosoma cruzi]EAN92407.1 ubiquitin-conjugating enzyme E2, putative [Trypanosoma cruzi]KAF8296198.1 putative ubiquitin-conjugating enzyme E2 [Trypanosoma cruzi]PWV05487.1 putative ubiquitin-conjugating enzyme E2 [Trypanosoma cruzi]RNC56928.1 ubiquitin-conjugating enzyme E2 [Trypanosoma cruzi]|eukprot:XP_814258.1 ubiquitin-conjugating enzyme E2 [Trypanosoma cruzi strain CL Brener]
MKNISNKRIIKDLKLLLEEVDANNEANSSGSPHSTAIFSVDTDTIYNWILKVKAPADSVYGGAGNTYQLSVLFSDDYPHEPPTVRFVTPVYSPLVTGEGGICDRMVNDFWTPDQHASDVIKLVLDRVFSQYKSRRDDDVNPEARHYLEKFPQDFAARVRRGRG